MRYSFAKMHGAGNDYIYMDRFHGHAVPSDPAAAAAVWSRRHFSIGADGLILILPHPECDAEMRMFNADGSEGKMCGNGIRCVGKYLYDTGLKHQQNLKIMTKSGVRYLKVIENPETGKASALVVNMGRPCWDPAQIPVQTENGQADHLTLALDGYGTLTVDCVSMGNPHAVCFVSDVDAINLETVGPLVEHHPAFPEGVNAEFVEVMDSHTLKFRVWERGSGETLACGTGVCAACAAAVSRGICRKNEKITVHVRGGTLEIVIDDDWTVYMAGPAELAYQGEVEFDG